MFIAMEPFKPMEEVWRRNRIEPNTVVPEIKNQIVRIGFDADFDPDWARVRVNLRQLLKRLRIAE